MKQKVKPKTKNGQQPGIVIRPYDPVAFEKMIMNADPDDEIFISCSSNLTGADDLRSLMLASTPEFSNAAKAVISNRGLK